MNQEQPQTDAAQSNSTQAEPTSTSFHAEFHASRHQELKPSTSITGPGETSVDDLKVRRKPQRAGHEGDATNLEPFGTVEERDSEPRLS